MEWPLPLAGIEVWQALLLAVLQGVTEWLPISSSGHLVIAQHLLGIPDVPVAFDILLHLGTLAAVLVVYRARVWGMTLAILTWPQDARRLGSTRAAFQAQPDRRLALFVAAATIPTAVVGLVLEPYVEASFRSLGVVAVGLFISGILLLSTTWARPREDGRLRWSDALIIGLAQSCSLFRGLSRSGTTISSAMWRGVDRRLAADFSFLLSIPVFLGATILKADEMVRLPDLGWGPVALGFLVSFGVGIATLRFLVGYVARKGVRVFGFYCLALSGFVVYLIASGT